MNYYESVSQIKSASVEEQSWAQCSSHISGWALQTCLQHRRSPASAICWPWPARHSSSRRTHVLLCVIFTLECCSWHFEQEARLPQRNSASAAHDYLSCL